KLAVAARPAVEPRPSSPWLCRVLRPRWTSETLQVRHQVDQLADRHVLTILGHDRQPAIIGIAWPVEDQCVRIHDGLDEIARVVAADAAEIRPRPCGVLEALTLYGVTGKTLEPQEHSTPPCRVARRRRHG